MASKIFKFYCKIVGIKYLFETVARFINELEQLSSRKSKAANGDAVGEPGDRTSRSMSSRNSLLTMEMEVDPNKFGDNAFTDSEANVYQLILACQKVFTTIRTSVKEIPPEFKRIFINMQDAIMKKFQSEEAVYKSIGGFFYLRFVAPAITAPQAYGLLEHPPNPVCQRQLVLIGKVIQNLANMIMPGAKETFMLQVRFFFREFFCLLKWTSFADRKTIVLCLVE
jgi:hypothetical protein